MNKTISINIGNTNFNINEDAYKLLRSYLDSIKKYFHKMDPDHEIVKDIENRIAENFLTKLGENKSSIDISDVRDLIKIMGTLEDFKEAYNIDEIDDQNKKINNANRLYRNTSDKIVGGVASGIANYFSIDPLLLRVSFVLATIFGGFGILIYIICWIAIPGNSAKELVGKEFYRDPDNKIVAGVAAGIANYFNIDVSFIRIFFILSLFIGGFGIIAYLIILVSSKEAKTVSEKMNMQGSKITLENMKIDIPEIISVPRTQPIIRTEPPESYNTEPEIPVGLSKRFTQDKIHEGKILKQLDGELANDERKKNEATNKRGDHDRSI